MDKKADQKKTQVYMKNYVQIAQRIAILGRVSTRQFMGSREPGDPRVAYLASIHTSVVVATAQLEVLGNLMVEFVGVSKEDFLKAQAERLDNVLKSMETDLCVTGWDQAGNPILDLPAYVERTKLWPK